MIDVVNQDDRMDLTCVQDIQNMEDEYVEMWNPYSSESSSESDNFSDSDEDTLQKMKVKIFPPQIVIMRTKMKIWMRKKITMKITNCYPNL